MPFGASTPNPTSTITLPSVFGRSTANEANTMITTISASGTVTFSIETEAYPAVFYVYCFNTNGVVYGNICLNDATPNWILAGTSGLVSSSLAANQILVSVSGRTVTLTAHGTFGTNQKIKIVRIV